MSKFKLIFISVIVVMIVVSFGTFIGCKTTTTTTTEAATETAAATTAAAETTSVAETTAAQKEFVVGFAQPSKMSSFYFAEEEILRADLAEKGITDFKVVAAENDPVKQKSQIEDLISAGVDLIIVNAVDSKAILSSIQDAHNAGIPVICHNRAPADDPNIKADGVSIQDTVEQAYIAVAELGRILQENGVNGKIINVMGSMADENAVNRKAGMEKACKEFGIEILTEVPTEWDINKAYEGLTNALKAFPDANSIYVASDFMTPSIKKALEANNKLFKTGENGHIWWAGTDVLIDGCDAIKAGYIDTDCVFDLVAMAKNTTEMAWKLLNGETLTESVIQTGGTLITQSNVDTDPAVWAPMYERKYQEQSGQ